MIDVVFLLIIFFLVSSHLARQESQLPLPLPVAESGEEVTEARERVVVNLLADGSIMLAGRTVDPDELQRRLSNEVAAGATDLEVRIRSDRDVAFQFIQPILLAISKARVNDVTFAVTKR
jgi:biopolymer transport protein ExbD